MIPDSLPSLPIKPGDVVLGKYRVERTLGEGGMGIVLAIRHAELDELFAMKLMKPGVAKQPGGVERFLREARAAAKLQSDHVARVYDVGRLDLVSGGDGTPYMLMEHLSGCDLHTLLATHGRFSASEVAAFLLQAIDAITEAHALGIVHRDLKPENLFIARRPNGTTTLKVLDFGISKIVRPDAPGTTHTSNLVGSPYYMSPEQMRGSKDLDHRTDVWAMGVIAYELLTDRVPFPGESVTEVCASVLEGEPPPIQRLAPDVPDAFVQIVSRCLQRKPADRFQSSDDLAAALRRVARDLGASPRESLPHVAALQAVPVGRARSRTPSASTGKSQTFAAIKLQRVSDPSRTTASGGAAAREEGGGCGTTEEDQRGARRISSSSARRLVDDARANSSSGLEVPASSRATPLPASLPPTIQATSEPPPPRRRVNKRAAALVVALVAAAAVFGVVLLRRGASPAAPDGVEALRADATEARRIESPTELPGIVPTEAGAPATTSSEARSVDARPGAALAAASASVGASPPSFSARTATRSAPTAFASSAGIASPPRDAAPASPPPAASSASPPRHEGIY
ncbi:MAG: protein kinase [Polyangiaceae bacterium]